MHTFPFDQIDRLVGPSTSLAQVVASGGHGQHAPAGGDQMIVGPTADPGAVDGDAVDGSGPVQALDRVAVRGATGYPSEAATTVTAESEEKRGSVWR